MLVVGERTRTSDIPDLAGRSPSELHQHGWGLILSVKGVRPSLSLTIPMRLGDRNVTHFVLFDKWGKP